MKSTAKEVEIAQLIDECSVVLKKDPSCLQTRAIRGHACMKAKKWNMAAQDFSAILEVRCDDIYGRFSRGMAHFKGGKIEKAHEDFSKVLKMKPNHVMARYARAGCYNTEGEFTRAIQDYTIALRCDEDGHEKDFRGESRLYLHETAEKIIHDKLSLSYRSRDTTIKNRSIYTYRNHINSSKHNENAIPRVTINLSKKSNENSNHSINSSSFHENPISVKRVTVIL